MKSVLLIHDNADALGGLIKAFERREWSVAALPVVNLSVKQLKVFKHTMIVVHLSGSEKISSFMRELKENASTSYIPVFALAPEREINNVLMGRKADDSDFVLPDSESPDLIAERICEIIESRTIARQDPLTGLITGAPLSKIIDNMCEAHGGDWCLIFIKLSGLKAFNHAYGYEKGDEMVGAVAAMLRETVEQDGEESDIIGRFGGDSFCIISNTKKVESICRKLRIKSERAIRKFYSPFELMKGFITIETKMGKEDFILAELLVAAAMLSSGWSGNSAYLRDIVKDLIVMLENNDNGYVVYKV